MFKKRVLIAADIHQWRPLLFDLRSACACHKPDVLVLGGDLLDAVDGKHMIFNARRTAQFIYELPAENVVFIRGNHEDANWADFVSVWPTRFRPLVALHCESIAIGPLVIVGFPCEVGNESTWIRQLRTARGPEYRPQQTTSAKPWLTSLMGRLGEAGRTLWVMHEPPMAYPIAKKSTYNPRWRAAVQRYSPLITVSGHDHSGPDGSRHWYGRLGKTYCLNVGQTRDRLRYTVVDFDFPTPNPCLPFHATFASYPTGGAIQIDC